MWINLIYLTQNLLWMRGILQLTWSKSQKRYAMAAVVLGAFFLWGKTIGFMGNEPPVWMVTQYMIMLLLFEGKAGEILVKYLFCFFYIGMFSGPIWTFLSIGIRCSVISLESTQETMLVDALLILILAVAVLGVNRHKSWKCWIRNVPLKYYGIGFVAAFCASGIGSFSEDMMEGMIIGTFVFYRIMSLLLEELVYLSGIFIAYLVDLNRRYQKESALKGELLEQSKEYFVTLENQMRRTQKIRHDMKFHLWSVETLLKQKKQEKALEYLEIIIGKTETGKQQTLDVENQMVNAVLEGEAARMDGKVYLECTGELRENLQADDFDLCTIFANLLSNAREACDKLKQKDKRICLRLKQYEAYQVIEVENPVEEEVDIDRIGSYTSKKNTEKHGLGLLNVMETVEKNGGSIKFAVEEGNFRVTVHLRCRRDV